MGVSIYKTLSDIATSMQQILHDVNEMMKLMDGIGNIESEENNN